MLWFVLCVVASFFQTEPGSVQCQPGATLTRSAQDPASSVEAFRRSQRPTQEAAAVPAPE